MHSSVPDKDRARRCAERDVARANALLQSVSPLLSHRRPTTRSVTALSRQLLFDATSFHMVILMSAPPRRVSLLCTFVVTAIIGLTVACGSSAIAPTTVTGVLTGVAVAPTSVVGGAAVQGTVTLSTAAGSTGLVVTLTSSNTAVTALPSNVTVPAGAATAAFAINTVATAAATPVIITAAAGGSSQTANLTVMPGVAPLPVPADSVIALSVSPDRVSDGTPAQGVVTIASPAPSGGVSVALSSTDTSLATTPIVILIPPGATGAMFTVNTAPTSTETSVTITATAGGASQMANLTVSPTFLAELSISTIAIVGSDTATATLQFTLSSTLPGTTPVTLIGTPITIPGLPASLIVMNGAAQLTFGVPAVADKTVETIQASAGGTSSKVTVTICPASADACTR